MRYDKQMEEIVGFTQPHFRINLHPLLNKLFDFLFFVYVFITIFLPSGSIYGINLKLPLYVLILPLALYTFFRKRATIVGVIATIGIPTFLSVWVLVSLLYGFDFAGALRQYNDIVLTLLMCWLTMLFCGKEESRQLKFLKLVVLAEIATALLKVGLISYALARGIPVVEMVTMMSTIFGVNLMSMDLGSLFGRVQFLSDALIPICIFIVLRHRDRLRIGSLRASLVVLLLFISVLFSFSRYFWAFTVIAFVLGLLLGRRDRFQAILVSVFGIAILLSLPALIVVYQLRFSQEVAGGSDQTRVDQGQALEEFFIDAPYIGHGLGSYTHQIVRDTDSDALRYSYEMQLLALAGQVGLLGMTLFFIVVAWCYRNLWWRSNLSISDRIGLGGLLVCWLAAGLYNPLLFNPIAGVIYASLAVLGAIGSKKSDIAWSDNPNSFPRNLKML